jgi:hypothetical protein
VIPLQFETVTRGDQCTRGADLVDYPQADSQNGYQEVCKFRSRCEWIWVRSFGSTTYVSWFFVKTKTLGVVCWLRRRIGWFPCLQDYLLTTTTHTDSTVHIFTTVSSTHTTYVRTYHLPVRQYHYYYSQQKDLLNKHNILPGSRKTKCVWHQRWRFSTHTLPVSPLLTHACTQVYRLS